MNLEQNIKKFLILVSVCFKNSMFIGSKNISSCLFYREGVKISLGKLMEGVKLSLLCICTREYKHT